MLKKSAINAANVSSYTIGTCWQVKEDPDPECDKMWECKTTGNNCNYFITLTSGAEIHDENECGADVMVQRCESGSDEFLCISN
jgi:hypothetical protein